MVVEEDATAVTKFGFVRVITEGLKVISCLFERSSTAVYYEQVDVRAPKEFISGNVTK
jgi:hypothetical protein